MDQEVGVWMDDLTRNLRYALQSPGTEGRRVTAIAAGGVEQVFAPPGSYIVELASCRNGECLSIEGDIPYDVRAHFNVSGAATPLASAGAGLAREEIRGHAHVAIVSAGGLLQQVRRVRLPAESAQCLPPMDRIEHDVCPARDP